VGKIKSVDLSILKLNSMNLTIEDLKLIRMGLNKVPVSHQLWDTIKSVDAMLAEHNLKYEMVSKPRRKYQRGTSHEYVFNPINK
jgi:hypothetical protein